MIFTFAIAIILYFVGGIVRDISPVAAQMTETVKVLQELCANPGSGIAPA